MNDGTGIKVYMMGEEEEEWEGEGVAVIRFYGDSKVANEDKMMNPKRSMRL